MRSRMVWRCTLVMLVAGCAYEDHQRRLTIAPDPVPCADGTPGSCLRITDALGDSWITGRDEIAGFTYEPGFTYEVLVEEASEAAEIEAASAPRLQLIQVVSKTPGGAAGAGLTSDLGGTRWVLSALGPSDHPDAAWAASGITAEFDVPGERLSGFGGCNSYSAALAVSGDRIEVSEPVATRKACPPPVMTLEQEYLERIARASAFAISGDRLDVSLADGSGMAFRAGSP
jgi:heat shock protein HslJ